MNQCFRKGHNHVGIYKYTGEPKIYVCIICRTSKTSQLDLDIIDAACTFVCLGGSSN